MTITATSKKEVNDILKSLGAKNVSMIKDSYHTKPFKNWQGKTVKGIQGGSQGPMTCTNAHIERNRAVMRKIHDSLVDIATDVNVMSNSRSVFNFEDAKGKKFSLVVDTDSFPTYAHNNYDPSYETWWLTLNWI
jgi:hypothetical protein